MDLPVTIAVGKFKATSFTTSRICKNKNRYLMLNPKTINIYTQKNFLAIK